MADTIQENPLLLIENRQEGSIEVEVASRFAEMADSFLQSKSERLRQDGELYKKMMNGELQGFDGLFFYNRIPRATGEGRFAPGMAVFDASESLGRNTWVFVVDCEMVSKLGDWQLKSAMTHEIQHVRQMMDERRNSSKKDKEVEAVLNQVAVYSELKATEGAHDELLDALSDLLVTRFLKMHFQGHSDEVAQKAVYDSVVDYLKVTGYSFPEE